MRGHYIGHWSAKIDDMFCDPLEETLRRKPKLRSSYNKWDLDAERNIVPIGIFIIKVDSFIY
jgi:hypothetical protein